MYICDKCNCLVDVLSTCEQFVGMYGDEAIYENYINDECSCGGMYEIAAVCSKCHEYYPESDEEKGLCQDCQNEIMSKFSKLIECFSQSEKEIIWEAWSV